MGPERGVREITYRYSDYRDRRNPVSVGARSGDRRAKTERSSSDFLTLAKLSGDGFARAPGGVFHRREERLQNDVAQPAAVLGLEIAKMFRELLVAHIYIHVEERHLDPIARFRRKL